MKRSIQYITMAFLAVIMAACGSKTIQEQAVNSPKVTIETTTVQESQLSREVMLPGELKPWNRVNIMARVNGYVGKVHADRGDHVKKGQTLTVLEAPELVAELNATKGKVATAQAQVIETESRLRASLLTYKRLLETSKTTGAVSANEMDIAYAKMMADSALTTSARGASSAASAQLTAQQQLVNYLTVRAPFDGIIIERNISPGALIGTSGNLPMFILEDQSVLRLTVAIPENMANSIPENSEVVFTVPASPGEIFKARYARNAGSLQEINRSMFVEFDAPNPNRALKTGMYAEATVPITRSKATLVVPATSLIATLEGNYVIRVVNGSAQWISVKRGNQVGDKVEIFGNIKAEELIVLKADPEIRDGQKI